MIFLGLDISLNHGAAVAVDENAKMVGHWYYTDVAGVADRGKGGVGARLVRDKKGERHQEEMKRLAWVERWLDKTVLVPLGPDYAGIEDYALRAEQGAHQLGEIGGIARILLWFRGIPFRRHDPISVKMYAAHDGTAQKDLIEDSVRERWRVYFGHYNAPPPAGKKQSRTTSEDLADAYAIARLVRLEYQLRAGLVTLAELEHDKERQVFNRVTKTYPVSLLGRDWIRNPSGGTKTPHGRHPTCSSERCTLSIMDERGLVGPKMAAIASKISKGG